MNYLFMGLAVFLLLCIATMAFFSYLAAHYRKGVARRALRKIDEHSQYRKKQAKPLRPNNDFLAKDKVAEKRKEEELMGVVKYSPREQELGSQGQDQDETKIVGLAKPVGFWSKFIMNQKIGFLVAMGIQTRGSGKGYWQNLIKAQSASQGKDQNRGR